MVNNLYEVLSYISLIQQSGTILKDIKIKILANRKFNQFALDTQMVSEKYHVHVTSPEILLL